jgi:pyruvate dehydrogenase complex dehydrogenase (E1) component
MARPTRARRPTPKRRPYREVLTDDKLQRFLMTFGLCDATPEEIEAFQHRFWTTPEGRNYVSRWLENHRAWNNRPPGQSLGDWIRRQRSLGKWYAGTLTKGTHGQPAN